MMNAFRSITGLTIGLALSALLTTLSGCAPLVLGGAAVGGALVASDRRTSGAQLEDESIEISGANRIREALDGRGHVTVVSYNRQVLLTGEVPTAQLKQQAEKALSRVENVRGVVNELAVLPDSSITQRSKDALVTGRVKATMIDAKDVFANAFKVLTERGNLYLMGRVTQREANRATEIARATPGVERVVRVLEIISEDELQRLSTSGPARAAASK